MRDSKEQKPIVLQVLPEMEVGGVERGALEIAEGLQKHGIVNFVASQGGRLVHNLKRAGIKHFELPLKTKNPFKMRANAKALEKIIRENGINVVHARSRAPAWSAYWAAKKVGVKYMTTFHGTYGLGPWGIKKAYNKSMLLGELVIAISNHIKNHILKNYKIADERKIRLIHRCVDVNRFSPDAVTVERKIKLIKKYNIPDDKPVVLLGGRITHWKGQHLLIEAMEKLKSKNVYAIIAGGDQGRSEYSNSLKEMAKKKKLASKVMIDTDVVDDFPALMSLSTIVLSAALEPEAFGRMAIEGQAMGRIVIASNIGGSLENVVDGVSGFLFESENVQDLADKIDHALSMSEKDKKKMSDAAIKNVKEHFTKEIMCDKTIEVYKEILKS